MSCRRICRPSRAGAAGFGTQSADLRKKRVEEAAPIPRSRPERLREAKRRMEEELEVECRANAAYEAYRARGVRSDGRRFGRPPKPYQPPAAGRP